ncbi:LysR family transcriptional regulator [Collinsella tanakaei]|uniref:LysR family transcriptional regulator n=1 Tax=Collinsella tanakaei TaxID=626935 RepID=UPI001959EA0E|nr:LysR family transcriptional regulator [Collinsella tanakaei]MBM6868575.1 LysR family transcriptional regulator [Collinsella tanakaei]
MNDRELIYVKTIAEEHSVSAAARKLFIAQPSLSQSLSRIEDSLGTKLFDRTTHGLQLTSAGKKYLQMANQVLKLYDDLKTELHDADALKTGSVTFGITRILGRILLPEVLPAFCSTYPNIKIRIVEGNSKELDRALTACEIGFAVMHRLPENVNNHIDYNVLWDDPFVVTVGANSPLLERAVATARYPHPYIDIHDLADQPLLTVPYGQRIRQVLDLMFMRARVRPNIMLETRDYSTVQCMAARGIGYTIGPQSYTPVANLPDSARFLSLDTNLNAMWHLCLATFRNGTLSRADSVLASYFKDAIERIIA